MLINEKKWATEFDSFFLKNGNYLKININNIEENKLFKFQISKRYKF